MPKFKVTLVRALDEYASVIVEADSAEDAEDQLRRVDPSALPPGLAWVQGDDREAIDVIDSEEVDQ